MEAERWLPVPEWTDLYEVSSYGRVRNIKTGRIRRIQKLRHSVNLQLARGSEQPRNYTVHRLVMLAFVGPRPDGMVVRHIDGDFTNCHLNNLAYGTQSENMYDEVQHGTHHEAARTHCPQGHAYTEENVYHRKDRPGRQCKICTREKAAKRATLDRELFLRSGLPSRVPHGYYAYCHFGCRCDTCSSAQVRARSKRAEMSGAAA